MIRRILSLSQAFLNNTELKIFGRHRESTRTACIVHKRSATELRQPPGEQTLCSIAVPSINTELECLFAGWLL